MSNHSAVFFLSFFFPCPFFPHTTGIDKDAVSQTAANIHIASVVRNKDIRKFLDGAYVSEAGTITKDL